jgi:uncharacterized protein
LSFEKIEMRAARLYVDTSALLKCYLAEKNSDEVESFLASRFVNNTSNLVLSSLSSLEWHCAMRRRERNGEIDARYRLLAEDAFRERLASGYYEVLRVENALYEKAYQLIEGVTSALRTLDALHLAAAQAGGLGEIVTADQVMAEAAEELGLKAHYFK